MMIRALLALAATAEATPTRWLDARPFLHGTGFSPSAKGAFYDRMPAAAQQTVRPSIWSLSRDSAGLFLQFVSNATSLAVNVTYIYPYFSAWHFPSTGLAGLDLYAFDEGNATWRWVATTDPHTAEKDVPFSWPLNAVRRNGALVKYRLHLPTYNGVSSASLGFGGDGAVLIADSSYATPKPVVFYGTSITQGGVASRPGMAFTNILSRRLDREVLNFGFSGSCLYETNVTQWLATIDAAAFIVDCMWNPPDAQMIADRTVPLVKAIRAALPPSPTPIPIVLVESTEDGQAWARPFARGFQRDKRAALAAGFKQLSEAGDDQLYYVSAEDLYRWSEKVGGAERAYISPTVGGCHPSDLGQMAIADFYSSYLPTLLAKTDAASRVGSGPPAKSAWAPAGGASASHDPPPRAATTGEARLHEEAMNALSSEPGPSLAPGRSVADGGSTPPIRWSPVGGEAGLVLMGRVFNDTLPGEYFDRLPGAAKGVVQDDVWMNSRMSTGMMVPFVSNSSNIYVNYSLDEPASPLWHMPASGTSGMDLFMMDESAGVYRFVACLRTFPNASNVPFVSPIVTDLDPGTHRFLLHFPLRKHVVAASVGVDSPSTLQRDPDYAADGYTVRNRKPIVWYGTSIDQGGVASRPGSTYTNVLSRTLKRHVLNFGFAGSGRDELSVARFLATIPAALIVLDCLPNMNASLVAQRTAPIVRYFREHGHPTTPIVLAEGTTYGLHWLFPGNNDAKRDALEAAYAKLSAGDANLHLVSNRADELFANDELTNPTVGGVHPSDLGHREIASFYEKFLPPLLRD